MISKTIHYCWFGGKPLPKKYEHYIDSWKKYCPDYEIKRWDETNFDYTLCKYTKIAAEKKKWAFVSDYARFKILYEYGGVYFDTDVEIVKPIDELVEKGSFMGMENEIIEGGSLTGEDVNLETRISVAPGLGLAAEPGLGIYKELIELYESLTPDFPDDTSKYNTVVDYTTEVLRKHGLADKNEIQLIDGIYIYPKEYFNPMNYANGKIKISAHTYSIHHYAASWVDPYSKFRGEAYRFINRVFGSDFADKAQRLLGRNK